MNKCLLLLLVLSSLAFADTPPPGTVKSKTYSGDGNSAIGATGSSLNVNVTNASGLTTVNQGTAGLDPWLVHFNNSSIGVTGTFWQATQPVSGTFWQATQPVSLVSLPALATGANTIGNVNINGTVPVSGTITTSNTANGDTGSTVPDQATQVGGVDGSGDLRALKVSSIGVLSVDASGSTVPVSGTFWQATQPVSGTVTANAGSGTMLVDGSGHTQPVSGTFWQATQPVSGTFWQATQPVSAASLPLPSGAATSAKQPALGTAGTPSVDVLTVQGRASMTPLLIDGSATTQPVSGTVSVDNFPATQPVSGSVSVSNFPATQAVTGTFWQATQPVSAASLPLPSGAATSAKQPALGTAGTPSSDVLTIQGVTSMTALKVDGSGVTQPVSGTFWQATQPVSGTFWQATQPVSIATAPVLVAGSAIIGKVGIDQTTPGTTNGVQVNAALPAGSNVIGHVIVDTAPTTAVTQSGTWNVNSTPVVPAAVTVKQAAITIGTSAVRLTTDGSAPSSTRVLLVAQLLSTSTANCFFGSSSVTSSSTTRGVQMFAGQSFSFTKDAGDYYAICDSSAQTFFITEQE